MYVCTFDQRNFFVNVSHMQHSNQIFFMHARLSKGKLKKMFLLMTDEVFSNWQIE